MQKLRTKVTQLGVVLLTALMLAACGTAAKAPATAAGPRALPQDPALRITTVEVMDLFSQVYGDKPLVKATLDTNNRFLLVDTRPLGRFQEGTVPGSINIPTARFGEEIPKLPRDRMIIFYCGGVA